MSSRRSTTSRIAHARVLRPPAYASPERLEEATPPEEEDTDENRPARAVEDEPSRPTSTSRTRTPADKLLQQLLAELHENEDASSIPPAYLLALEALARRGREDRRTLESKLKDAEGRLAAKVDAIPLRPRRIVTVLKGIGLGSLVTGLVFVANLLIARGESSAASRQSAAEQRAHAAKLESMSLEIGALRAQATGHDVLIKLLVRDIAPNGGPTP